MRTITRFHLMLLLMVMLVSPRIEIVIHAQDDTSPLEIVVNGNSQFAFDLYHSLEDGAGNIIYSPYSISTALAMVYAGARDTTASQMAATLHFEPPQDELHAIFAELSQQVTAIDSEYADPFQLNVANAVWVQDGYPILPAYSALLSEYYGAGLHSVDFANDSDTARNMINDWVSEQTNERIPEMLSPPAPDPLSRLVLTNAIYFNASWLLLFDEAATVGQPFTLLDGTEVMVPMMHMSNQFGYIAGDNYQAIQLEYQPTGEVVMMIILPASGEFAAVEAALDADWFRQTAGEMDAWNINLSMPRFGTEMTVQLSQILAEMGMPDAFGPAANFSAMADPTATGEPLFIGFVLHKAFIEVDEKGTEAAAATAIGLGGGGPPNEPFDVEVNRPFIYVIYHRRPGNILFMGRVLNPLDE